jgi:hypothetical protein
MAVYCYDLVRTRSLRFTPEMDAFLRAEWFPGLALAQLAQAFAEHFPKGRRAAAMMERLIANRLLELGVRNRMTGEAK